MNQVHGIIPKEQILETGVRHFLGKNEALIHFNWQWTMLYFLKNYLPLNILTKKSNINISFFFSFQANFSKAQKVDQKHLDSYETAKDVLFSI